MLITGFYRLYTLLIRAITILTTVVLNSQFDYINSSAMSGSGTCSVSLNCVYYLYHATFLWAKHDASGKETAVNRPLVMLLEKEMATHFSVLSCRIPWTEKSGGLWFRGLQTVCHDWVHGLGMAVMLKWGVWGGECSLTLLWSCVLWSDYVSDFWWAYALIRRVSQYFILP